MTKGHVPTPPELAKRVVAAVFDQHPPRADDRVLYPGCGTGPFAAAVERVCDEMGLPLPEGVGVDTDPELIDEVEQRDLTHTEFHQRDFLDRGTLSNQSFDYILGNPPYVPIERLSSEEKDRYRSQFQTATGRFDLYLLFFERAVQLLSGGGVLSFVTPEKFEYVGAAEALRQLLTTEGQTVETIRHIEQDAFGELITFPAVTTVRRASSESEPETRIELRDGTTHSVVLPDNGESWASTVRGANLGGMETGVTLSDVTERISPGLATGADSVYVLQREEVPEQVDEQWLRPTVGGSQLPAFRPTETEKLFVCPYDSSGNLATESELGTTATWLSEYSASLESRSCVEKGKRWYAWHETPPMDDVLQPKILFRDIAKEPVFYSEPTGEVVPKHSVYYAVPEQNVSMADLLDYLNSPQVRAWLEANCQRAHNGYYRLQSRVLSELPVPTELASTYQATL